MLFQAREREIGKEKKISRAIRKEKTLHKWTPDSAGLLDAYLSVGYG